MTCSICDLSGKTTTHLGNTDQFIGWSLMMILLLHMIITTYKLRNSGVLSRLGQLYAFLNARTWSRHGNHACCSESWLQFWFDFLKRQTCDGVRQQTTCLGLLDLLMQRFLGPLCHSQLFGMILVAGDAAGGMFGRSPYLEAGQHVAFSCGMTTLCVAYCRDDLIWCDLLWGPLTCETQGLQNWLFAKRF